MTQASALLRDLVAIPSVSGDEVQVASFVEQTARGLGLDVVRDATSVRVEVKGRIPGRTLALVSHLDVVPPGEGWTRDPFTPSIEGTRLYGRGSGDAKASVAAMLLAAADLARARGPERGRLLVVLGYAEETRDTTMPQAVQVCGPIDTAVVGEPTSLAFAVAQRGLLMAELIAHGEQRHAGRVADDGACTQAVLVLAQDLAKLPGLFRERPHPLLGHPSVTPTLVQAGVARNVVPATATAVLDVRSTPAWTHDELAAGLRAAMASEVRITSDRLVPCETPAGSELLAVARRLRPNARCYGSPTCSDWVFLRTCDAIKCGPGSSSRSHTPDEYVELDEVDRARAFYSELAVDVLTAAKVVQ